MEKPWITGPKELLVHGISHLNQSSDFDIRMGMICIDNSVELMIKTYLGLPKRVTKIESLSRNKYNEIIQSFPKLIDALEEYCSEKLTGIDLGDIEWFHRLRNELYHNGNGITVEKTKVLIYAEIAKNLFYNLFGIPILDDSEINDGSMIGEYISNWIKFEQLLNSSDGKFIPPFKKIKELYDSGKINDKTYHDFAELNKFRNDLVHGQKEPEKKNLKIMTATLSKSLEILKHII